MIAPHFKHNAFGINQTLTSNYITEIHVGEFHAVVTQLGECKTEDLEVAGSSPAHGTTNPSIVNIRQLSLSAFGSNMIVII